MDMVFFLTARYGPDIKDILEERDVELTLALIKNKKKKPFRRRKSARLICRLFVKAKEGETKTCFHREICLIE
jgi:hypothetical protein